MERASAQLLLSETPSRWPLDEEEGGGESGDCSMPPRPQAASAHHKVPLPAAERQISLLGPPFQGRGGGCTNGGKLQGVVMIMASFGCVGPKQRPPSSAGSWPLLVSKPHPSYAPSWPPGNSVPSCIRVGSNLYHHFAVPGSCPPPLVVANLPDRQQRYPPAHLVQPSVSRPLPPGHIAKPCPRPYLRRPRVLPPRPRLRRPRVWLRRPHLHRPGLRLRRPRLRPQPLLWCAPFCVFTVLDNSQLTTHRVLVYLLPCFNVSRI